MSQHCHDCTGPDLTCPCGFKFVVPRFAFSMEIWDNKKNLSGEALVAGANGLSTDNVYEIVDALRRIADKLEAQ